ARPVGASVREVELAVAVEVAGGAELHVAFVTLSLDEREARRADREDRAVIAVVDLRAAVIVLPSDAEHAGAGEPAARLDQEVALEFREVVRAGPALRVTAHGGAFRVGEPSATAKRRDVAVVTAGSERCRVEPPRGERFGFDAGQRVGDRVLD